MNDDPRAVRDYVALCMAALGGVLAYTATGTPLAVIGAAGLTLVVSPALLQRHVAHRMVEKTAHHLIRK